LNLLAVSVLRVTVLVGQGGLNHIPDLGPLGDVRFNVVPGVFGGWWGQWRQLLAAPR
jgi:hypothetical protein